MLYTELTDKAKARFLHKEHIDKRMLFNKLRRDAKRLGVQIRTKGEAQSVAFAEGRLKHPTKGKQRTDKEKVKISETRAKAWREISQEERERLSSVAKENWDNMSEEAKRNIQSQAQAAVREAAKHGSKLEKFLFEELTKAGFHVEYHTEHKIVNERMHLDLFLPGIDVAIEIDGPSHFLPIWGEKTLARNQKSDTQKPGLLLEQGFCVIRIKQNKVVSAKFKRDILSRLLVQLEAIKVKKPPADKRNIEIGA